MIGAILVLALLFIRGGSSSTIHHGRPTTVMNHGKNIYLSVFARSLENPLDPSPAGPQTIGPLDGRKDVMSFPDSTEYFTWIVTNGVMNVDFSFFSTPDMKAARSTNPADFTPAHNAWAVTSGINHETPDDVPVLYSANLSRDSGTFEPLQSVDQHPYLVPGAQPFGDKAAIVILNSGAAFTVQPGTLTPARFNPPGATNQCLYPSAL